MEGAASLAIALGALLDGVPESFVGGNMLLGDQIGLSFLAAVFISNVPESVSAQRGARETRAFAAGAIITMLADTMMPGAFEQGARKWAC